MAAHKFRSNLWHNHDFSANKPTQRFYPQVIHVLFQSSFTPCRGIPTKTPTVQKPCIDRASPEFSGLHDEKERQILRFNALLWVHLQGLEPWAHWLRVSCSTNWARGAYDDPYRNRTDVKGVRGLCLNRLTNGPYVHFRIGVSLPTRLF